jgi:hypothetical protein
MQPSVIASPPLLGWSIVVKVSTIVKHLWPFQSAELGASTRGSEYHFLIHRVELQKNFVLKGADAGCRLCSCW